MTHTLTESVYRLLNDMIRYGLEKRESAEKIPHIKNTILQRRVVGQGYDLTTFLFYDDKGDSLGSDPLKVHPYCRARKFDWPLLSTFFCRFDKVMENQNVVTARYLINTYSFDVCSSSGSKGNVSMATVVKAMMRG